MKRALVTGSDGFVGRHFVRALEADGWDVSGCDLKSGQDCRDVFRKRSGRVDLLVHAAAIVGGRETIDGEPLRVASDLAIDSDAFQWAVANRVGRVLYFSSSAAYPIRYQRAGATPTRLAEADLDLVNVSQPDQSYGWTKVTGELLAGMARAEGVPVTVVRPFSGYGTDQDLTYPFPSFVARALAVREGARSFPIWGTGKQTRDWIHVDDVVAGALAVMEDGTEDPVNLCSGIPTTFDQLAELMLDQVGAPRGVDRVELVHDTDRPAGVHYRVGDPTRFHSIYQPRVCLEEGIGRALRGEV